MISNLKKRLISIILLLVSIVLVSFISISSSISNSLSGISKTQEIIINRYALVFLAISLVFCVWNLIKPWNKFWWGILIVLLLALLNYPVAKVGELVANTPLGCMVVKEMYTCASAAVKTLDPKYCAIMKDEYKEAHCYPNLAKASKKFEYCLKIPAFSGSLTARDMCLSSVQKITKDKNICELINDPRVKSNCLK